MTNQNNNGKKTNTSNTWAFVFSPELINGVIVVGVVVGIGLTIYWSYGHKNKVCASKRTLTNKTAIVTGSNCGIGYATAYQLADQGAEVILACRNLKSAEEAAQSIIKKTGNKNVEVRELDLNKFESIHNFCLNVKKCHILVNNAGVMLKDYQTTSSGLEKTMMTNYVGPYTLTLTLLPILKETSISDKTEVKVINVASRLEKKSSFGQNIYKTLLSTENNRDNEDSRMMLTKDIKNILQKGSIPYSQWDAYSTSKLFNILFTYELSNRLKNSRESDIHDKQENIPNITVNAVTPGMVNTQLSRYLPLSLQYLLFPLKSVLLKTPNQGASNVTYLCDPSNLNGVSGKYYGDNGQEVLSSPLSYNRTVAQLVYQATNDIIIESTNDK
eukprot:gene5075-7081_t